MSSISAGTILYHGSDKMIRFPKVQPKREGITSDFGQGVYFTLTYRRARDWANKRARQAKIQSGYISSFRLKKSINSSAKIKIFEGYSAEWIEFIRACRMDRDNSIYEIVVGNVADARTYDLIEAYEKGLIYQDRNKGESVDFSRLSDKDKMKELLRLIAFEDSFIQVCFRTDDAINEYLAFDTSRASTN